MDIIGFSKGVKMSAQNLAVGAWGTSMGRRMMIGAGVGAGMNMANSIRNREGMGGMVGAGVFGGIVGAGMGYGYHRFLPGQFGNAMGKIGLRKVSG